MKGFSKKIIIENFKLNSKTRKIFDRKLEILAVESVWLISYGSRLKKELLSLENIFLCIVFFPLEGIETKNNDQHNFVLSEYFKI